MTISMPKFLHRYADYPIATQLKVKRLFFLEALILGLLIATLGLLLKNTVMLGLVGVLAAANGTALVLLLRGRQSTSETLHFVSLALSFTAALFFATDRNYDLPLFALVAVLFLLDILLTTTKSWRLYFFVALMIVVPVVSHTLHLNDFTKEELRYVTYGDLGLFEAVLSCIGIAAIVLYRDSQSLLTMMLAKARESDSRYEAVRGLFDKSQGSLKIGETLESASTETLNAVNSIKKDIQEVRNGILSLDETVKTYGQNSLEALKAAENLEEVSQEQSSSVTETASVIEQMAASIRNISDISESKRFQVDRLVNISTDGQGKVREMSKAMSRIETTGNEVMEVISIIEDVAAQTNLLAMNAAIEAAHAGDAGRGFAVVADEIRKLSEATNENTARIKSVLESSNQNIAAALNQNDEVSSLMAVISKEVEEVSSSIGEVIASLTEMSSGTHEVNTAVSAIRDLATRTDDTVKSLKSRINDNDSEVSGITAMTKTSSSKVESTMVSFENIVDQTNTVRVLGQETKISMRNLAEEIAAI